MIAGLACFVFGAAFFHVCGVDIGFHIRTGAHILETGAIPCRNTFSFTQPDEPWLCQQWWPGVLLYAIYTAAGIAGLIVAKALMAVAMFMVAALGSGDGHRRGAAPHGWADLLCALAACTAAVALARVRFFVRPFMLSGIFFAVLTALDRRYARAWPWHAVGVPVLMAGWANTHAGVMYGYVLLGVLASLAALRFARACVRGDRTRDAAAYAWCRRELVQRVVGVGGGIVLSAVSVQLINPSGARVLLLPLTYFFDPFWHGLILEFRSMTWSQDPGFFVALAVLAGLTLAARGSIDIDLGVTCLIFAALTLRSQRCVLFFALAAVPYAASLLRPYARRLGPHALGAAAVSLALLWGLLTGLVFTRDRVRPFGVGIAHPLHPLGVYAFMRDAVAPQPVFNSMAYGAGMLWWLYPDFRPFIDGRCEAYSKEFWRDVYRPVEGADARWRAVFDEYGITAALLYTADDSGRPRLASALRGDPDWALVAFDDFAQLYLKRTAANAAAIAAHAHRVLCPGASLDLSDPERIRAAHDEALRAVAVEPACCYARLCLARTEFALERWASAARHFARFLAHPGIQVGGAIHRDYGYALYRAGAVTDADRVLRRLERDPEHRVFALYLRHRIAAERGDTRTAVRLITLAHAEGSNDVGVAAAYREWVTRP